VIRVDIDRAAIPPTTCTASVDPERSGLTYSAFHSLASNA
jgi:hypothetical protein